MSTTRSLSPPAPATEPAAPGVRPRRRLFLVGHGSTRAPEDNRSLMRHAERLAESTHFESVDVGLLYGEPSAKQVAQGLPREPLFVVPFFMAGGHYPSEAVPALFEDDGGNMNGRGPVFCQPVGLHPRLADLVIERTLSVITPLEWRAAETTLLLIGHGSEKSPASWQATEAQARRMRRPALFRQVTTAYLEQAPHLEDILALLHGPVVAVGLFAGDGAHAGRDIPERLQGYDAGAAVYLGAVGSDKAMADLVLDQVAAADPSFRR